MKDHLTVALAIAILLFGTGSVFGQHSKTNQKKYQGEKTDKPNIIFILTDDMGWGDLGIFYQNKRAEKEGQPFERSPNLDKLASQGAQLRNHYDAAPVCAPSRASILLGRSQGHANVRDNQFDKALEDNHTMASVLKKLGYSTAAIGKWGLQGNSRFGGSHGDNWPANPLNRGFDYFMGYMRHRDGHEHYPKEGLYSGRKQLWLNHTNITPNLDKSYTADLWTAGAKQWITKHERGKNRKKPFFMYLAYETPHAVLELPTQAYPSGGGLHGGLQWTGKPHQMINTASGKPDSWVHPDYRNATYDSSGTPKPWPAVFKRYATSNRRIDSGVGDIIQLLKDLHIADNTLVIFTSDNGPSRVSYLNHAERKVNRNTTFKEMNPSFFRSFGPFDGIKRDVLEGGARVPAIAWWPGHIPGGQVIKTPSISYDWLATFTSAAGVEGPEVSDGVSLLPQLTGKGNQQASLIYSEYFQDGQTPNYQAFAPEHRGRKRRQMQMIRMGDYVGLRYDIKSQADKFEIYNVTKDPNETKNLMNIDEHPESARLAESLQSKMKAKVLQVRRPNKSAPRPYDDVPVPAVQATNTAQGIKWKLYKGVYPWIPKVNKLSPSETGRASNPQTDMVDENSNEIVYYKGYMKIPETGDYTFYMKTDSKAELRIHQATVIDEDYNYWGGVWKSGGIKLEAGLHPFRLYYQRKPKIVSPSLEIKWANPAHNTKHQIPAKIFRY